MNGRKDQKTSPLKYVAVILLIVFLVSAGLFVVSLTDKCAGDTPVTDYTDPNVVTKDGVTYVKKDHIETVLVLGLDKFETDETVESYNNDKQADFAMLLIFDNRSEEWSMIHLNRDTMVEVDLLDIKGESYGTDIQQLALAHTQGDGGMKSYRNVRDAVERLLPYVDISNCLTITMDAVPVYNDIAGGVTLEVLHDFSAVDPSLRKGEVVTLRGDQSLTYIRARKGMEEETNESRMERQRQYMDALYSQTLSRLEGDPDFVSDAVTKLTRNESVGIEHDLGGVEGLQDLASKMTEYTFVESYTLEGEYNQGKKYLEFYPDEEKTEALMLSLLFNEAE